MGATDLPGAALGPYGEAQVRFAVAAWPMRAAEELRSALIFRALSRAARDCDMPPPWPARFASAMRDEVRHARLCVTVGTRLRAPPPRYDPIPVRARLDALPDSLTRTAALLLIEVAMGETISMYLFRACRRATVEPLTRAALGVVVGDEVRHQRLGWTGFTVLWPMLGARLQAAMQCEAARGLAACEQQNARPAMRWLQERRPFHPDYAALGVLHPEARVEAFYSAVERLVLPRLTRVGIDGPLAWKNRYRGAPR
jgi:hypothetical protein